MVGLEGVWQPSADLATVPRICGIRSTGSCSLRIVLTESPHRLTYPCDVPGVDAVERALAVPGTAVEVWYEPTLPLPDVTPQLWQLRVNGQVVLDREWVAAV
jgi:hypothetical protein